MRLVQVPASTAAARELGRGLAVLHDAGAEAFGVPPDGWSGDGFFGPLDQPLPMVAGRSSSWGAFLAECRLTPLTDALREARALDRPALDDLTRVADRLRSGTEDDDDHPARLHGDLWSGNVVWTAEGATLVDPAAHGGHRETDPAMLAPFGLPHLRAVLDAYQEVHPLRRGWQHRVGLHQLYPVGVHALLFGGEHVGRLRELASWWVGTDERAAVLARRAAAPGRRAADGRANGTALAQVADSDGAGLARVGVGPCVPGL